jgi:hypothetical protein
MIDRLQFGAVVEVSREPDGSVPEELITAAYHASRDVAVLLVLDSISRAEVDRILDRVVSPADLDMPGLIYADGANETVVMRAAMRASRIFASTDTFRSMLQSRGLRYSHPADADSDRLRSSI